MNQSWTVPTIPNVQDRHVTIKKVGDGVAGKGMFTTVELDPSDEICSVSVPLMLALDTARLGDTCYDCHNQPQEVVHTEVGEHGGMPARTSNENSLKLCSGCKVVRYCSRQCQKFSWNAVHKIECDLFKSVHPRIMPNHMRAIIRFLILKERKYQIDEQQWEDVMNCPSHLVEIAARNNEEYVKIVQMARATIEYTGTKIEFQTILQLYCKLKVNSFTLMTPTFDPIGLCMHPFLAKINHSCKPNAYIRFDSGMFNGRVVQVIPLRPIDCNEEITISYVEENKSVQMRQAELLDRYFFRCTCSRCTKDNEIVQHENHTSSATPQALLTKVESLIDAAESNTSKYMPVQNLSYALHLLTVNTWQHGLYPYPQVLQKLVVAYIDDRQFNLAMAYAALQYFDIDPLIHEQQFHPIRLVHMYVLVRLMTVVYDGRFSDPFDQELDLKPFDVLEDLGYLRTELARKLSSRTLETYPHGAMWLRMSEDMLRRNVYGSELVSEQNNQQRHKRLRKLIEAMYERNNDRSRWHS